MQVLTMREKNDEPKHAPRESAGARRTCVGCARADDPESLVRVVCGPRSAGGASAPVAVDLAGGRHGRGAHVHPRRECLTRAAKNGLSRSFKTRVETSGEELAAQLVDACDRRIAGLLMGAWRGRLLAVGADAVTAALDKGAPAVVVAADAGGVAERGAVGRAVAEGRAVAWRDKKALGSLFGGRDEVAVCAILSESIASEVARARRLMAAVGGSGAPETPAGSSGSARGDACRSREVR
jgi:predicted RNA-binding protein YlxR (DUF448 family)